MTTEERAELVRRWSAAIRQFDPLEMWLTESHWDEQYWDDVARLIVDRVGNSADADLLLATTRKALQDTFPGSSLDSDNGLYRDRLPERLSLIVAEVQRGSSRDL
jgi:hypothetical protein